MIIDISNVIVKDLQAIAEHHVEAEVDCINQMGVNSIEAVVRQAERVLAWAKFLRDITNITKSNNEVS